MVFCFKIIFGIYTVVSRFTWRKLSKKCARGENTHKYEVYPYLYIFWVGQPELWVIICLTPTHPAHFNSLVKALITEEPQVDARASFVDSAGAKLRVRCHVALAGFPCFPLKQIHQVNIN